jgi:16S rRNA (cytosine967-C5)-methyltransferase
MMSARSTATRPPASPPTAATPVTAGHEESTAPQVTARSVALDVIDGVLKRRRALDDALATHPNLKDLSHRDRQFVRALVNVTLRHLGQIDHTLAQCLEKPLPARASAIRNILRLGAAQSMFLGTPAHAVVDTMVGLASTRGGEAGYKGLVNAVLRRIAKDRTNFLATAPAGAISLPDWLWASWVDAYGVGKATQIATAHLYEPPLDFTLARPGEAGYWAQQLHAKPMPDEAHFIGTLRRTVASEGAERTHHQRIEDLPGYEEGAWWVQDLAASLPVHLFGDIAGKRVIDLCAAPGGKTLQLAAAGAFVTALDRSRQRLARVKENLARLKLTAEVECADAMMWDRAQDFDAVLLDAPCSATGTIRRHPDVAWLKDPRDLPKLANAQDRLLDVAARLVKPGGTLVYCVCSLQPEEGVQRIAAFLQRHPDMTRKKVTAKELGGMAMLLSPEGDLRSLPCHLGDQGGLDGFYAARLIRKG